ncbi:hypothetical protein CU097_007470, partial [Rhizopus azygosporus]
PQEQLTLEPYERDHAVVVGKYVRFKSITVFTHEDRSHCPVECFITLRDHLSLAPSPLCFSTCPPFAT